MSYQFLHHHLQLGQNVFQDKSVHGALNQTKEERNYKSK